MMATRELEISQQKLQSAQPQESELAAYVIVGIGFLLRIVVAASTFFDPDEAFHYALGHQPSLRLAYHASLSSAHPPLLILLIYCLRALGNSEIVLRLPSVIAGTASCWLTYQWLIMIADRRIALSGLILLAWSPPLFALESELRQYSVLLLFIAAALYWFEKAVQQDAAGKIMLFSAALWLALTAHYGALLFAVAMGVYALLRFQELRPRGRLLITWGIGQVVFLAEAIFFYKTHVPVVEQGISDSWLRKLFYHAGDHALPFLLSNTYRFFHFLFGQPVIGAMMLLLFIAGLVCLIAAKQKHALKFRWAGLVILFALALSWALALAGLYPWGGTRHGVFLLPFVILAIGSGLVSLLNKRAGSAPIIAAAAVSLCSLFSVPAGPRITPPNQNVGLMRQAVQYARVTAAPGELVLVDQESMFPFRYYFCREDVFPFTKNPQNFSCSGYRVHKSGAEWDLSGEHLSADLRDTRAAFGTGARAKVLLFQTGWSVGERNLRTRLEEVGCSIGSFGKNILACEVK